MNLKRLTRILFMISVAAFLHGCSNELITEFTEEPIVTNPPSEGFTGEMNVKVVYVESSYISLQWQYIGAVSHDVLLNSIYRVTSEIHAFGRNYSVLISYLVPDTEYTITVRAISEDKQIKIETIKVRTLNESDQNLHVR